MTDAELGMKSMDWFIETVRNKVLTDTPYSFVRFSDGEIMLLNRKAYYKEYVNAVHKLWGYVPTEDELGAVAWYLWYATYNADLIGFPTENKRARSDYFFDAIPVFERHFGKVEDRDIVSMDSVHTILSSDRYGELLYGLHTLNYVSCWDLDDRFHEVYGIKNINRYALKGEPKFSSKARGERQFPYEFFKVREWIKERNCKGNLCLVGGGVFSKVYNTWFKEQGGVSLDIGSVFDALEGKKTRGSGRGLDIKDETYKL